MSRLIDWPTLTKKASELIVAEQKVSYEFLREKLGGISHGTIVKLLKRLKVKGLVRQGKRRGWVVVVNPDGSPKNESDIPAKRHFKKKVYRKTTHGITKRQRDNGAITDAMKIEFVQHLASVAEGQKAKILKEVLSDLKRFSKDRKFLEALRV